MQVPIIILCGTRPERRLVSNNSFACPVCGQLGVQLVEALLFLLSSALLDRERTFASYLQLLRIPYAARRSFS